MTAPDGQIYCVENTVLDSHLSIMPMINKYAMQRVGLGMPTTDRRVLQPPEGVP